MSFAFPGRKFFFSKELTTTAITGPSTGNYGSSLTFDVTVTNTDGSGPTPEGSVNWYEDAVFITNTALVAGAASINYTPGIGVNSIDANYVPSSEGWFASSDSHTVTVKYQTTTVVSEAPDPAYPAESVTLTATCTKTYGGGPVDAGVSVEFFVGGVSQGTANTNGSGIATKNVGAWSSGSHSTDANYPANGDFLASSGSGSFSVVAQEATTTTVSGPTDGYYGTEYDFDCDVVLLDGSGPWPQGYVNFYVDSVYYTTRTLTQSGSTGHCSAAITINDVGVQVVEGYYDPLNANWTGSNDSTNIDLVYATQLAISEAPDPGTINDAIVISIVMTSTGGGTPPDQNVDIYVDSVFQGVAVITSGTGSLDVGQWAVGTHTTQGIYPANGDYDGSSNSGSFTIA